PRHAAADQGLPRAARRQVRRLRRPRGCRTAGARARRRRRRPAVKLEDVRAIQYGDVLFEGERWPNSLHVVEHPAGRVLVDTGMIDSTPALDEEWSVRYDAEKIPRDVVCVINTHLHFDHCGG